MEDESLVAIVLAFVLFFLRQIGVQPKRILSSQNQILLLLFDKADGVLTPTWTLGGGVDPIVGEGTNASSLGSVPFRKL